MPTVELHLLEGYTADDKRRLGEAVTDAVRLVIPAEPDAVTVIMHELKHDNYMRGRIQRQPAEALKNPAETIRRYLSAMEERDLDAAKAMHGEGFTMQFPGATPMTGLQELLEWSKSRYRHVQKTYERFDAMQSEGSATLVYCFGTLAGTWLDGTTFEGIRFIDRFELVDGKITRQDVWNDLGEARKR